MRAACAILLSLVGLWGCGIGKCSGIYNCPLGGATIMIPTDISARITSASGDTCQADAEPSTGFIRLTSNALKACHVEVRLDDGTTRLTTVTFHSLDDCCGDYTASAAGFEADDGGAND